MQGVIEYLGTYWVLKSQCSAKGSRHPLTSATLRVVGF